MITNQIVFFLLFPIYFIPLALESTGNSIQFAQANHVAVFLHLILAITIEIQCAQAKYVAVLLKLVLAITKGIRTYISAFCAAVSIH